MLGFMYRNSHPMHSIITAGGLGLDCTHSSQIVLNSEVMQLRVRFCSHSQPYCTTSSNAE